MKKELVANYQVRSVVMASTVLLISCMLYPVCWKPKSSLERQAAGGVGSVSMLGNTGFCGSLPALASPPAFRLPFLIDANLDRTSGRTSL